MGAPSTGTRGGGLVALFSSWGLLLEDARPQRCPGHIQPPRARVPALPCLVFTSRWGLASCCQNPSAAAPFPARPRGDHVLLPSPPRKPRGHSPERTAGSCRQLQLPPGALGRGGCEITPQNAYFYIASPGSLLFLGQHFRGHLERYPRPRAPRDRARGRRDAADGATGTLRGSTRTGHRAPRALLPPRQVSSSHEHRSSARLRPPEPPWPPPSSPQGQAGPRPERFPRPPPAPPGTESLWLPPSSL